jgi:hypothetical protein
MIFVPAIKAMKTPSNKFLFLITIFVFTIKAKAGDRWETLRAINLVENPTNQTHVGRFGELGPYQFRPATWRMHTDKPFRLAIQRKAANEVAVKHYEWIKRSLEQANVHPSAFNIAMAWNCGLETVLRGRAPSVSYDYAQRVANLIEMDQELSAQPAVVKDLPPSTPHRVYFDENAESLRFRILEPNSRFVLATR